MDYDDYKELQRLRQAVKIFKGTILNGLPEIEEDELIDSDMEIEKNDRIIGQLDDLEKKIYTLIAFAWDKACNFLPELMKDEELDFLVGCCYEENADEIVSLKEDILERYLAQDADFPEQDWIELVLICDRVSYIMKILNDVLMSRFPKESFEAFIIKKGFNIIIVEDKRCLITRFNLSVISPN